MLIVLDGTVHKHVYTVNKQVLMKRRDWCTNNSKELRSETTHYHRNSTCIVGGSATPAADGGGRGAVASLCMKLHREPYGQMPVTWNE